MSALAPLPLCPFFAQSGSWADRGRMAALQAAIGSDAVIAIIENEEKPTRCCQRRHLGGLFLWLAARLGVVMLSERSISASPPTKSTTMTASKVRPAYGRPVISPNTRGRDAGSTATASNSSQLLNAVGFS